MARRRSVSIRGAKADDLQSPARRAKSAKQPTLLALTHVIKDQINVLVVLSFDDVQ